MTFLEALRAADTGVMTERNKRIWAAIVQILDVITDDGQPSLEHLKRFNAAVLTLVKEYLGPRSCGVLMVGMPLADSEHDRFAALSFGPCLSTRGLLAWGERAVGEIIDESDTSRNGKGSP